MTTTDIYYQIIRNIEPFRYLMTVWMRFQVLPILIPYTIKPFITAFTLNNFEINDLVIWAYPKLNQKNVIQPLPS